MSLLWLKSHDRGTSVFFCWNLPVQLSSKSNPSFICSLTAQSSGAISPKKQGRQKPETPVTSVCYVSASDTYLTNSSSHFQVVDLCQNCFCLLSQQKMITDLRVYSFSTIMVSMLHSEPQYQTPTLTTTAAHLSMHAALTDLGCTYKA